MKRLIIGILIGMLSFSISLGEGKSNTITHPSKNLQTSIWTTQPGYSLTFDEMPFLPFRYQDSGPSLIFSDDPEYLKAEGICGQETIGQGTVRVYLYNCNHTSNDEFKFSIVLKNLSDDTEEITITKRGTSNPSGNYAYIGSHSLLNFYKSNLGDTRIIPPQDSALLDPNWEKIQVKYDALAHGFYELYCDRSTQVTLCGLNAGRDTLQTYSSLSILSTNSRNAGRGLFPHSNRSIVVDKPVDTINGIQRLRLADGKIDPWIQGVDQTSGKKTHISGNYGVLYTIKVPMQSSDDRYMAVLIVSPPAGSAGCPFAGVIGTKQDYNLKTAGYFLIPSDQNVFRNNTTASLVGIYKIPKESVTISFEFSPPGSSCLPVDFIFVPVDKQN